MNFPAHASPIDYLAVGHITKDLTPDGPVPGGTVTYAGLTAHAFGLRAGVVTAGGDDLDLMPLAGLNVRRLPSAHTTTFENVYTPDGREQRMHSFAAPLSIQAIPSEWMDARIVHLGPVAGELDASMIGRFPASFVGVTPQGWFRVREADGRVSRRPSLDGLDALAKASAMVLSLEDVNGDEAAVIELAEACPVLALTLGRDGCRVYWHGDARRFPAPRVDEVDPTGAGDVFAASFFIRLVQTQDPWEAARFAVQLAALSVTRPGLGGVPRATEIEAAAMVVI